MAQISRNVNSELIFDPNIEILVEKRKGVLMTNQKKNFLLILFTSLGFGLYAYRRPKQKKRMIIRSSAFDRGERIPLRHTCEGRAVNLDVSPPLEFKNIPHRTKSLAILMYNPHSETGIWPHWVVFNLSPDIEELPENADIKALGGVVGINEEQVNRYSGPCPGFHLRTYQFELLALDKMLDLDESATFADLRKKMKGHIIEKAILRGRFKRPIPQERAGLKL